MLTILKNQTFPISPIVEATDTGWTISGQTATHSPCNPGTMKSIGDMGLVVGKSYVVTYEIIAYTSGSVRVILGTNPGTLRSAAGVYTETILCVGAPSVSFFSDGSLTIQSNFKYYELVDQVDNSLTIAFYDKDGSDNKKWATHYSYSPEMMIGFVNSFFAIKDGNLWKQNVNNIRNNFFGVQYPSVIKIYGNQNPTAVKLWYGVRVKSNKVWYCPNNNSITILPTDKKPNGMATRLKKKRFVSLHGDWFADFMRNILDPRFETIEEALRRGDELMGNLIDITFINEDNTEVVLFEIDIKSTPINYTY